MANVGEPDVPKNDVIFTVKINTVFFKELSNTFCTFEWWNTAHEFVEPVVTENLDAWQGDPDDDLDTIKAECFNFKTWFSNAHKTKEENFKISRSKLSIHT